jgi:Tol biopolymer transport system component
MAQVTFARIAFTLRVALPFVLAAALVAATRAAPVAPAPPEPTLTLTGHTKSVFNVAFSPDGKYLATASKDHTARLWDATTGKEVRTFKGHKLGVYSVTFSPDGKTLATSSEDQTVRVWDVESGKELACSSHVGEVYHVVFSPDGKRVATCGSDNVVILWDAATLTRQAKLEGHTHRVVTVSFSPDGRRLASACGTSAANDTTQAGGEVKIWDVATGKEVTSLPPATSTGVLTIVFSPDGKRLAGACMGKKVRIWEAATGQESLALEGHTLDVYHVAFSPDGRRLASSSARWNKEEPGEIKLWDLATAKELTSFKGHAATIWSLAFSPDGTRLASASGTWSKEAAGDAKVWDITAALKSAEALPPPDAKQLDVLWADLAGKDAGKAYRAVWAMSAARKETLALVSERAKAPPRDPSIERIPKLIADLDADSFEAREKASEELAKLGAAAHPALKKALDSTSAEVRLRAAALLEKKVEPPLPTADEMRAWRTIEVLQRIGTEETRPLLQKFAKDAAGTPLGDDAAAVLERTKKAPK